MTDIYIGLDSSTYSIYSFKEIVSPQFPGVQIW